MYGAPNPQRRRRDGNPRGHTSLVVGVVGIAAALLVGIAVIRGVGAPVSRRQPDPTATTSTSSTIIYAGTGSQTTPPFYLAGGTYLSHWSAWGEAAEFPPCTHSAELMAVDPASTTGSGRHVADLARLAHVPATGASDQRYLTDLQPGDYYLDVNSECGWQIAITPN
jgi:hypothetical protein